MAEDYLKNYNVDQVAAWYLRLAAEWDKGVTDVKAPMAGLFLRTWIMNRNANATIDFDAPEHLRADPSVIEVQSYHREVFLTNKKGRFTGGTERWVGILPRIQGLRGFTKWDMKGTLSLEYESLSDIAPNALAIGRVQQFGSNAERDIMGSLRGFQLKSQVAVTAAPEGAKVRIRFASWNSSGTDRYDWNYNEYLTVVNPDYGSKAADAIRPQDRSLVVYHKNAERLEKAGKAAPYNIALKPWSVTDARVTAPSLIDPARKLN